jgi:hypothetical protein
LRVSLEALKRVSQTCVRAVCIRTGARLIHNQLRQFDHVKATTKLFHIMICYRMLVQGLFFTEVGSFRVVYISLKWDL